MNASVDSSCNFKPSEPFPQKGHEKLSSSSDRIIYIKDLPGERRIIGDHTHGKLSVVSLYEETSLEIGKYCSMATNISIFLRSKRHTDWITTHPFLIAVKMSG